MTGRIDLGGVMRGDEEKRSEVEITLEIVESSRVLSGTYLAFTKFISDFYKKKMHQ